jgi:hypothetical protein
MGGMPPKDVPVDVRVGTIDPIQGAGRTPPFFPYVLSP